jgi:invasion protein IalB
LAGIIAEIKAGAQGAAAHQTRRPVLVHVAIDWGPLGILRTLLCSGALGLALLGLSGATALAQLQTPDLKVKSRHGDWEIACRPPPRGAKSEVCGMVQIVADESDSNVVINVQIQKYSSGTRVLRVYAPSGVALSKGLSIRIDDKSIVQTGYSRCAEYGCLAQIQPDEKLLDLLKTAKKAAIVIYRTEEESLQIPISLAGFGQALSALN